MKGFNMKSVSDFQSALSLCAGFSRLNISVFEKAGQVFIGPSYTQRVKELMNPMGASGGLIIERTEKGAFVLSGKSVFPYLPVICRGIVVQEEYKAMPSISSASYLNMKVLLEGEDMAYQKTVSFFCDCLLAAFVSFLRSLPSYQVMSYLETVIEKNFDLETSISGVSESDVRAEKMKQFERALKKDPVSCLSSLCKKASKGSLMKKKQTEEEETDYFRQMFVSLFPNQMKIMVNKDIVASEWEECELNRSLSLNGVKCLFVNIFKKITISKDGNIFISPVTQQVWPLPSCVKLSSEGVPYVTDMVLKLRKEGGGREDGMIRLSRTQVGDLSFMHEETKEVAVGKKKKRRSTGAEEEEVEVPSIKRRKIPVDSPLLKTGEDVELTMPMDLTVPMTPEKKKCGGTMFEVEEINRASPPIIETGDWIHKRKRRNTKEEQAHQEVVDMEEEAADHFIRLKREEDCWTEV